VTEAVTRGFGRRRGGLERGSRRRHPRRLGALRQTPRGVLLVSRPLPCAGCGRRDAREVDFGAPFAVMACCPDCELRLWLAARELHGRAMPAGRPGGPDRRRAGG